MRDNEKVQHPSRPHSTGLSGPKTITIRTDRSTGQVFMAATQISGK
jgi:hypothetical protein